MTEHHTRNKIYHHVNGFFLNTISGQSVKIMDEPGTYVEAWDDPNDDMRLKWRDAIEKECVDLTDRKVWEIVKCDGQRSIPLKWVFKVKAYGRFRARLVSLGYIQILGVDYEELHAPVISDVGFRLILCISLQNGWRISKLDVEAAFLLGKLEEDLYVTIPDGFHDKGCIAKLNSAIYGLVQASRMFYNTIRKFLVESLNFKVCSSDGCILMKNNIIIGLYVDDIIVTGGFSVVEEFNDILITIGCIKLTLIID